jgi:hypothetical protein
MEVINYTTKAPAVAEGVLGRPSNRGERGMTVRQATSGNSDRCGTQRQGRLPILPVLVMIDGFALGGLVALALVHRLLSFQLAVYAPHSMDAASVILDLMDDLLPYHVACVGGLVALLLITLGVWAWQRTDSWLLRYGIAMLILTVLAVGGWALLSRGVGAESVPPLTPTPPPAATSQLNLAELPQERGQLSRWDAVSTDTFQSPASS